jgi:uncharacterized protein YjiS (DUF1127 family)
MTVFETGLPLTSIRAAHGSNLTRRAKAVLQAISYSLIALQDWQARARERRQLLGLSDTALKDFGADRGSAEREGSKPFWLA